MEKVEKNKYTQILRKTNSRYGESEAKSIVDVLQTIAHILYQQMLTNQTQEDEK